MTSVSIGDRTPPGQHAPFATISDDDHSAWIIITSAIGIAFGLVTLTTRIFIRWFGDMSWGLDDSTTVAATVFFIVQSSLVLAACASGLGRSVELIPMPLQSLVQQLYYASNVFFLVALDMSKLSNMLFFRRLTSPGSKLRLYNLAAITLLLVSTVVFLLATTLQCNIHSAWTILDAQCTNWLLRWIFHSVVSCLFEVMMFVGPVSLTWGLQAPLKTKIEAVTPFALRLIVIPITIARLCSFDKRNFATNPTLHESSYVCWTQAELTYAVMAATFPAARRMIADLNTYYNSGRLGTATTNNDNSQSFPMTTLRSSVYQTKIAYARRRSATEAEIDDNDSQEMIIKRTVSVEVRNESKDLG